MADLNGHNRMPFRTSSTSGPLNIRTRDLPVTTNESDSPKALNQKRKIHHIDLISDDEDAIRPTNLTARKKSRSASHSPSDEQVGFRKTSGRKASPHFVTTAIGSINGSGEFRSRLDGSKNKRVGQVVLGHRAQPKPLAPQKQKPTQQEDADRQNFLHNLRVLEGVSVYNDIDNTSPPTTFTFVKESILGKGVHKAPEDIMIGCTCQNKHKQKFGCVYLNSCSCIQDSAPDDQGRKAFVYGASGNNYRLLRPVALKTRNHIYECNSNCDCSQMCKNRVVQHGRHVRVEIFKTRDRGWGLRCLEDLKKGQFLDTYRGEIITSEEADARSKTLTEDTSNNFFFEFDKFESHPDVYDPDRAYVCDGRHFGSPARFLNHSCEPNCAIFTVSYNHYDRNIYELAYFALEDVPKGTELTFDYYDQDEERDISDEAAQRFEREKGYAPTKCLCQSQNCRGYFLH